MSIRESVAGEDTFSFWNAKRFPALGMERRVLVMHADPATQRALTLLLRLKGFAARDAATLHDFRHTARYWAPQAFILDTRLDNHRDYRLIREFSTGPHAPTCLLWHRIARPVRDLHGLKRALACLEEC